jgi:spore germination protein YaaH
VHGVNKYLFIENAKSFSAKYALAIQYQLYGISVFRIGIEDPGIWNVFLDSKR